MGEQLGKGRSIDEVIAEMNMVAEGVKTCRVVVDLAQERGIVMPISHEVQRVCHEGSTAEEAYRGLLRYEVGRLGMLRYAPTMTNLGRWDVDTLAERLPAELGPDLQPLPMPWPEPEWSDDITFTD